MGVQKRRLALAVFQPVLPLLQFAGHALGQRSLTRLLLGNVLKLRGKTALDVMVPRADIVAMPEKLTLQQAIELIQREGHSRLPVYRENLDDIVGMVHIKDVFAAVGGSGPFDLKSILRKPLFVVPSIPVLDLLLQMRQSRVHMALVVDEYGGIDGLITIEDLVETIVGDISDEHDEDMAPHMTERPDGTIELDARTPIGTFEERLGQVLTEEERAADIDTVGGLVFTLVPLFAWWFNVSLWQAFVMDLALIVFFLCYTFVFNWVFDQVFGLPASAMAASAQA